MSIYQVRYHKRIEHCVLRTKKIYLVKTKIDQFHFEKICKDISVFQGSFKAKY